MDANDPDAVFNAQRDAYLEILKPVFLPDAPIRDDVLRYFASLFRVLGIEDKGWDPYGESKGTLNDLNRLMKLSLPDDKFPDADATVWRLGLLLYSHIVEMDAPYEVLTNLLRYRLGKSYSPSPFFLFLTEKEKKSFAKRGISTARKIEIIKNLSQEAGLSIGGIFDEFYRSELRNAVQHSDFILAEDKFRCRGGISGRRAFAYTYEDLDVLLTKAKAYVAAYFQIESIARQVWGLQVNRAVAYDPLNKGLIEILADDRGLMCGFAVHWPNGSMSQYKRGANGVDMLNCMLDMKGAGLSLFVGSYARSPGKFSPLVENDAKPIYQPLSDGRVPEWPGDDFAW